MSTQPNQPEILDDSSADLDDSDDPTLSDRGSVATFINGSFDEKTAAQLLDAAD